MEKADRLPLKIGPRDPMEVANHSLPRERFGVWAMGRGWWNINTVWGH
jgi:hypothetical protein